MALSNDVWPFSSRYCLSRSFACDDIFRLSVNAIHTINRTASYTLWCTMGRNTYYNWNTRGKCRRIMPTQKDNKPDAIESVIESLKNADSLADTPFSKLFHEARTTGRRHYTGVSLQVRVRDGEFEVHDTPVKTRRGEHLRGTNSWDNILGLPVRPFMETEIAKKEIIRQLKDFKRNELHKIERQKEYNLDELKQ